MEEIFLNERIQVYQEGIKYPISAWTVKTWSYKNQEKMSPIASF